MANITKIKAKDPRAKSDKPKSEKAMPEKAKSEKPKSEKAMPDKAKSEKPKSDKALKKSEKSLEKSKKPFILFRPFLALGRYLRDSWREIRQVRWPSRAATWKMVLAVFIYAAIFMIFILLLDTGLNFITNLILSK